MMLCGLHYSIIAQEPLKALSTREGAFKKFLLMVVTTESKHQFEPDSE